jgi:HD-GYP domain-containing protein (c-di-GMP phosphodiesterase class II)
MLKKIDVSQLRLGMHVHAFDGPWINHPFWRTKFLLSDAQDLAKARASAVRHVWINLALGSDVDAALAPLPVPRPTAASVAAAPPPSAEAPKPAPPRVSLEEELRAASAVCREGRKAVVSMFTDARLGKAIDAEQCLPLVQQVTESVYRNPGALVSLARLKTHDDYSYMHSVAVCALMVALGREMGLDEAACREAGLAGLVHDLGKALMPPLVLNKAGKLTDDEYAVMRTHPERGWELLQEGKGAGEVAMEVCLHHHEKMDGSGYPHKLLGQNISLLSRMGAVCDVYDAISSNRPYKAGWDPAESIARMAGWKGHFDEKVFSSFVRSIGIYPTGSLVRMASGRLGVVMEQNQGKPTSPIVKLFYSTKSDMPIPVVVLDLSQGHTSDRITGRESNDRWGFKQLEAHWVDPALRVGTR